MLRPNLCFTSTTVNQCNSLFNHGIFSLARLFSFCLPFEIDVEDGFRRVLDPSIDRHRWIEFDVSSKGFILRDVSLSL